MAERARAAVQQRAELLGPLARNGRYTYLVGARGAAGQRGDAPRAQAPEDLPYGLLRAAHRAGDLGHPLAAGTGQHALAAAPLHRLPRAQASRQPGALLVGKRAAAKRRSHARQQSTFRPPSLEDALGAVVAILSSRHRRTARTVESSGEHTLGRRRDAQQRAIAFADPDRPGPYSYAKDVWD